VDEGERKSDAGPEGGRAIQPSRHLPGQPGAAEGLIDPTLGLKSFRQLGVDDDEVVGVFQFAGDGEGAVEVD
jgi:hypothetical protein